MKVCNDCEGFEPPCCECGNKDHCCHACYYFHTKINREHVKNTLVEDIVDADISNPPEQVDFYPIERPKFYIGWDGREYENADV